MKVELTSKELKQLDEKKISNNTRHWLLHKENLKFEVGDVLIKLHKRWHRDDSKQEWVPENIANSDTKMPQRYVYIHEDEVGIGYLKQLKVSSGSLGQEVFALNDFDYRNTNFVVDPEYAEMQFLDGEFDIKNIHKKALEGRKQISKMNRKLGIKPKSLLELNQFFESLKVGDIYWSTSDYTGRYPRQLEFKGIVTKYATSQLDNQYDWDWRRFKSRHKIDTTDTFSIKYKDFSYNSDTTTSVYGLIGEVFYRTKPAQEEKK